MIITRCEHLWINAFDYTAISPLFDQCPESDIEPDYIFFEDKLGDLLCEPVRNRFDTTLFMEEWRNEVTTENELRKTRLLRGIGMLRLAVGEEKVTKLIRSDIDVRQTIWVELMANGEKATLEALSYILAGLGLDPDEFTKELGLDPDELTS